MHLLALFVALVLGCPTPKRVLLVGDSEVGHVKLRLPDVRTTEEVALDYRGGTSIEQWSAGGMFKKAMERQKKTPDTIVVFLGTNDVWRKEVPDLKPLFDAMPASSKCVWAGPVAGAGKKWPFTPKLKAAVTTRCTWVDSEDIPLADGWHPGWDAALLWLRRVWKEI